MEKQDMTVKNLPQHKIIAANAWFKEELEKHDMKLVTQPDQKVSDQQVTPPWRGLLCD